jgi:hypothetical protein
VKKYVIVIGGTLAILLIGLVLVSVPWFTRRAERQQAVREAEALLAREIPEPSIALPVVSDTTPVTAINLPIPFTSQAPHGNWDMPYQEACEEAAALMAIRYIFGNPILGPVDADTGILDLVAANEEILGYSVDQTAAELMDLIVEIDPGIPVELLPDPTIAVLKEELAQGHVIIVPAAGRQLKNPFYHQPGPLYHMLILRGYTEDGYFITNDPGTKRGEEYLYPQEVIMDAMGDWNDGDPVSGQKVVLVLQPIVEEWGEDYASPLHVE